MSGVIHGCACDTRPFSIGGEERDRWLVHMRAAVASLDPPADLERALLDYFDMAAESMRNRLT